MKTNLSRLHRAREAVVRWHEISEDYSRLDPELVPGLAFSRKYGERRVESLKRKRGLLKGRRGEIGQVKTVGRREWRRGFVPVDFEALSRLGRVDVHR